MAAHAFDPSALEVEASDRAGTSYNNHYVVAEAMLNFFYFDMFEQLKKPTILSC